MKESKENVLVAGANGTTGRKIIDLLMHPLADIKNLV